MTALAVKYILLQYLIISKTITYMVFATYLTAKAVITVFTIGIYQANRYILILHFYECVSHSNVILISSLRV